MQSSQQPSFSLKAKANQSSKLSNCAQSAAPSLHFSFLSNHKIPLVLLSLIKQAAAANYFLLLLLFHNQQPFSRP
jgi:hypothetical protein